VTCVTIQKFYHVMPISVTRPCHPLVEACSSIRTASNISNSSMTAPVATLGVHWAVDVDMSSFASPSNTSNMSFASTSTLQYVNSQLVAHGFSSSPGLCLDGLSNRDMEVVVKCVLGMLSQRVVRTIAPFLSSVETTTAMCSKTWHERKT
jgi:hypothetical protein